MYRRAIVVLIYVLYTSGCSGNIPSLRLTAEERIVGGSAVGIRHHPYQVTLQRSKIHSCGASIISRKWAVTAGHCVGSEPSSYTLGAGSANRYNGTTYNVSHIIRHPKYNAAAIDFDIALLKIKEEFRYGVNVQPIKLPDKELQQDEIANVTGWGATTQGGSSTDELMRVAVPIVDRLSCAKAYADVKAITGRMICAGQLESGGKDSCQGDSGGPLSANDTLYGIVSWGNGCALPKFPGVYTNVAYFRHWITNITGI